MSLLTALILTPYIYIGTALKINEPDTFDINGIKVEMDFGSKMAAVFEAGFESDSGWKFGYSHHSQWTSGPPFNNENEYYKDSIFIGKKWTFE